MADRYVYRLVVDQSATVWPASCWRCGTSAEGANPDDPYCLLCGLDLSPRRIGGSRRTFLSPGPVNRRARMIVNAGGQAHLERSEPVRWPDLAGTDAKQLELARVQQNRLDHLEQQVAALWRVDEVRHG